MGIRFIYIDIKFIIIYSYTPFWHNGDNRRGVFMATTATIRKAQERGAVNFDWLKSFHSFSFGHYYDQNWMGFQNLRVINDDTILGENGFDFHPHKNMEIITFMLQGELTHQDSMGNKEVIRPGDIQVMTAGTGVVHSEWNHGKETTKLLQIWVLPNHMELKPRYEQINFQELFDQKTLVPLAGVNKDFPIKLNANLNLSHVRLKAGEKLILNNDNAKGVYFHVYQGEIEINGTKLYAGDALMFNTNEEVEFNLLGNLDKSSLLFFQTDAQ